MNLSNILTQSSVRIIIALGVAGLIVTQGTDLSAGRQVGLAAVVAATLLQSMDNANKVFPHLDTVPIPLVILTVCIIGGVIGLVNGVIIAYLKVTPFITTLGTMIIVYGINSLYYDFVGASPVAGLTPASLPSLRASCASVILSCHSLPSTRSLPLFSSGFFGIKRASVRTSLPSAVTRKPRVFQVLTCR